ncbi:hypothetical protein BVRB_8g201580 [Beta vulgaris subsp. vulgaris]|uniref:Uncharacterized protein n=1 Tax=Beta vulgaris subsp. vulgaris TaxID=3555 RepID=A0A0J8B9D0_BETVV|nr:hypothetical protein BVRB_8g201580 [Beta vulgaris subsp. vulgaris]
MNNMDELKGELCLYHFDELDCSSTSWVQRLDFVINPFGIFEYARSLKVEGNTFYRKNDFKSAISQYSQAIKFLFFADVTNEEDKSVFLSLALSINLNLAACFIKEKNFQKVGELCSLVLMYDATNAKAYFRRAVAALELSQPDIALIDLIQALKIHPNNGEFQQKLNEVSSVLGLSSNFVDISAQVAGKDEVLGKSSLFGKEEKRRKVGERKSYEGTTTISVEKNQTFSQKVKMNAVGKDHDINVSNSALESTSGEKTKSTGSNFRFSNRKAQDTYLHITPSMYRVMSAGRTLHYHCSSQNQMISIRTLNPSQGMDCSTTIDSHTPMEMRHSPEEGDAQCKQTPLFRSDVAATSMDSQKSSCVSLLVPPSTSFCSPAKSTSRVNNQSTSKMKISSRLHSSINRQHSTATTFHRGVLLALQNGIHKIIIEGYNPSTVHFLAS